MEYTELKVWKETRLLVNNLYDVTKKFPKDEMYGLTSQMRRCAVSIPSNIAEGCGRKTSKESIHFFYISRGSLYELETQSYLALDQDYIQTNEHRALLDQIISCKKLLNGFINYYQTLNKNENNQPKTINK